MVHFNERELSTIAAICQTLIPSNSQNGSQPSALDKIGAAELGVAGKVVELLGNLPNPDDLKQVKLFLRLVELAPFNLAIAGIRRPFRAMSPAEREKYLLKLAQSKVPSLRAGFRSFKALASTAYFTTPTTPDGKPNPTWESLGYPGPLFPAPEKPKPIKPLEINKDTTLTCDVVIIGSGAGGGVVAGELAAAGKDVIVLEKGNYYNEADFNQVETEMLNKLYLDGGMTATQDQSMLILAGSCLGGGTVVNYTTSFATPERVRMEWDKMEGFRVFNTPEYEASSKAVHERLGVSTRYNRLSRREEVMVRGLEKLGWHHDRMPRNVRGCSQEDDCGYCIYGCQNGAKQSTLITYLQEAGAKGTRMVVNCTADTITTEGGKASGVQATVTNGRTYNLTVKAKAVVVAAGSLHSPALLLRSRLGGPAVGKNLRLHPVSVMFGVMEEEVQPWTGVMQAAYSDQFADLDGKGYGAKFETAPGHLATPAFVFGWGGGKQFKNSVGKLKNLAYIAALLRDFDGGQITINKRGQPVTSYRLSKYDTAHLRRSLEGAAQTLEAAGAREIISPNTVPVHYRPGNGRSLSDFMAEVDRRGWGPNQLSLLSFHQMGSCRMGSNPATSVVNQYNEVHTTPGLYVADASTFPTASGVNPMITIETIAHRAAQHLKTVV